MRGTFGDVHHPELGRKAALRNLADAGRGVPLADGPRAPLVGEHNEEVLGGELGLTREELRRLKESHVI